MIAPALARLPFIKHPELCILQDSEIHPTTRILGFVNIYASVIGADCMIAPFVEIGGAVIGNRTSISSHSYICPGVHIGDDCFIAHGVMFTNDKFKDFPGWGPDHKGFIKRDTIVGNRVRIGSGAVILPVTIGDDAIIGAGAVVTKDVLPGAIVAGNPARVRELSL